MAQFNVADVVGQFSAGQRTELGRQAQVQQAEQTQFTTDQARKLAPLNEQKIKLGIEMSQQLLSQSDQRASFERNIQTAVELKSLPDNQKAAFLTKRISEGVAAGRDMTQTEQALELVNTGRFDELAQGGDQLIQVGERFGVISAAPVKKLSSLQQKVEAEGLDPNTPEGQARARELNQGARTDPSLKPSDQQAINRASEGQLQSSTFANRVGAANEVLAELEATEGFDPTSIQTAFFEAIPGGNIALSDNEQRFSQAKRDFITAVLRKESGAAIGKDEFVNEDKKFFPQVGDGKAVLKQKALGRKRAFESLRKQSKGVFDIQFGQKTGALSKEEQTELQQLRAELG